MNVLMIHVEGKNLKPLSFKLYPDTKVFRMFLKFAKYNEIDLLNLSFVYKGTEVTDFETTVESLGCQNEDEIRVMYETHIYKKIKL